MTSLQTSIVIPCFNEERTILALLTAIRAQTLAPESMEVIIADGMSTDNTRTLIEEYGAAHPELEIRVIDNVQQRIPAGLNQAIRAARGEIIIRMDAHAIPSPDYMERSIAALRAGLGDNVGGVIDIRPGRDTWIGRAIAIATAHPLGVGDAKYRTAKKAGVADTVAFGCFFRTTIEKIGFYNESLRANEDYEINARLRESGYKIWVDPAICAVYYSRATLGALAKQYFSYGYWKMRMLRSFPKTLRWRQALPPIFVLWNLMLLLVSIFWYPALWLLITTLALYMLILAFGSIKPAKDHEELKLILGVPLAIMTMHFSWGSGFWYSLLSPVGNGK